MKRRLSLAALAAVHRFDAEIAAWQAYLEGFELSWLPRSPS